MTSAPWRCTRGRANRSPLIGGVARPTRPRVRARALGRVSLKWSCRRGCPAAWSPPPGPTCSTFFSGQGRRSSLRGAEGSTARSGGRPTYSLQETTCTSAAPLGRVGWRAASVATYPQGHWDIDFLLASPARACRVAAWALPSSHKDGAECRWAAAIFDAPGAKPVTGSFNGGKSERGFGAGDCRRRCGCAEGAPDAYRTHLFRVEWRPTLTRLRTLLCGRLVVASSRKGS